MNLRVIQPGLLTTVQDLGRTGLQQYGIVVSGAMDSFSFRVANLLVGNDSAEAALEITLSGPIIEFAQDVLIAITGADLSPVVNGVPVPLGRPIWIQQGAHLEFGFPRSGCRCYLAVAGGLNVPLVLQSRSTTLRARLGGFQGRSLQAGDILPLGTPSNWAERMLHRLSDSSKERAAVSADWSVGRGFWNVTPDPIVRAMVGSQRDWFTEASQIAFFRDRFQVTNQSDRMGYRLSGPGLWLETPRELVSEGVTMGTIQVPPGGQPIVLMADRPTTGGYPKIAQVASVDLPRLAQTRPGEWLRFQMISVDAAQQLLRERESLFDRLKCGIALMGE